MDDMIEETAAVATAVETLATLAIVEDVAVTPFSRVSAAVLRVEGINRVHQKAIRILRSTKRCLRMNRTTRMKKTRAAMISNRSSQSDFSRAVMRCFEVVMRLSRTSCVEDADFREAVEASIKEY